MTSTNSTASSTAPSTGTSTGDGERTEGAFDARSAGVLLHPTSLPGPAGSGDLGPAARGFVDFLQRAGQSWWQMLPVHPPDSTASPYLARSTFAGSPLLISPDDLVAEGWLAPEELESVSARSRVSFARSLQARGRMLRRAFARFEESVRRDAELREALERFQSDHPWLADWALYAALKARARGKPWWRWRGKFRRGDADARAEAREELAEELRWHVFLQFAFQRQWNALRSYASARGVRLLGDLPFFIAGDSADAWSQPHLFTLNEDGRATRIAGTPPDVFTETGQVWGNPLYAWDAHRAEDFAWWQRRIARATALFDAVRLDHFIGYVRHWSIPAGAVDARDGEYVDGPGRALFSTLGTSPPFVAEDLGDVAEDVEALRQELALPGIRVLVFGLGGEDSARHVPGAIDENTLCHPASHDNDTVRGWYDRLPEEADDGHPSRSAARTLFDAKEPSIAWDVVRAAYATRANTVIVQAQDLLGLDSRARMNRPGTASGNWRWRLREGQLDQRLVDSLRELTESAGRARPGAAPD